MKVRTRFAPSPTGSMHIGNLRTAFYAYALAKRNGGHFVVRIENTDQKREKVGGVEEINELLRIFNLKYDEYYVQSERLELYKKAARKLVAGGHAFYCNCAAKNAKLKGYSKVLRDPCRDKGLTDGAIKLRVPDGERVSFTDFVLQKEVEWETSGVGDATLLKSDGFPTYHLAVVVDDHAMEITHVLRGHDWMPSTPIHLLVYKFLGYSLPEIGHLTDILDPDGGKLSKRKGSTSVRGLLNEGYLPEALFNFVILAGWAPKDDREFFTLEEFVEAFDPRGFQKSNPVFNREKLDWFNQYYYRKKYSDKNSVNFLSDGVFNRNYVSIEQISKKYPPIANFTSYVSNVSGYRNEQNFQGTAAGTAVFMPTRMSNIGEYDKSIGFLFNTPQTNRDFFGKNYKRHLEIAYGVIDSVDDNDWKLNVLNEKLTEAVKGNGFKTGDFYMDLRIAVAGSKFTPPINESMIILGKKEALRRIKQAL